MKLTATLVDQLINWGGFALFAGALLAGIKLVDVLVKLL